MTETSRFAEQPFRRAIQIIGLLFAVLILEQNFEAIARNLMVHPTAGTLVGSTGAMKPQNRGSFLVAAVEPTSPLGKYGVQPGDLVVMDNSLVGVPSLSTRVPVSMRLEHGTASRHVRITPVPLVGKPSALLVLLIISYTICALFACFLLLYGRGRTSALELGIALAAFAAPSSYVHPLLAATGAIQWPAGIALAFTNMITGVAFLAFSVRIEFCANGRNGKFTVLIAYVAAIIAVGFGLIDRTTLWNVATPAVVSRQARIIIADILPLFITLVILLDASRRSDREAWRRHQTLVVGIGMIVVSQLVTDVSLALSSDALFTLGLFLQTIASGAGAGLMTYGVLSQRVIDVGFVINRTLVYASISLFLLMCFGLLEWAVNFLALIHGRSQGALFAACLALIVSLAFHRVRAFVERTIEGIFFRQWREREDELRTFLTEAPFFNRPEALSQAALAAFHRFAEGTTVAIYRRGADGIFERLCGSVDGFDDRIDPDAELLVKLRAKGAPIKGGQASLVLPMANRNELNGAVILGCRPDRSSWRPDQIDALANAARDIGQDLQVLELDRLQSEIADLSQQLAHARRPLLRSVPL